VILVPKSKLIKVLEKIEKKGSFLEQITYLKALYLLRGPHFLDEVYGVKESEVMQALLKSLTEYLSESEEQFIKDRNEASKKAEKLHQSGEIQKFWDDA